MAEKNLGKIAMTFAGDWDANTSYERLVAVTHQGSSWVSKREVPAGIIPSPANTTYWQKLAAKGEPTSVINDLITDDATAALSARMGKNIGEKLAQLDQEWQSIKDANFNVIINPHIEKVDMGAVTAATIEPDKYYIFGEVATLAVGLIAAQEGSIGNYAFQFTSPADAPTTLSLPIDVKFPVESDSALLIKGGRTYQISILNGLAIATSWEV